MVEKSESVAGDVQHNINMIKENNGKIKFKISTKTFMVMNYLIIFKD